MFRSFKRKPFQLCISIALLLLLAAEANAQEQRVEIAVASANLYSGANVVGTTAQGQQFNVEQTQGEFLLITAPVGGSPRKVWVRKADTRPVTGQSTSPVAPAATPPAANAAPTRVLRVKTESADVLQGSKAIARLRRGELHPQAKVQGRYYSVRVNVDGLPEEGWVLDTNLDVLPAAFAGPSLAGNVPQTAAEAGVAVDWKSDRVTLKLAPSQHEGAVNPRVVPPSGSDASAALPEAPAAPAGPSLQLSSRQLTSGLTPGTRSLWMAAGEADETRFHRIDLPAPQLQLAVATHRYPNFQEGLVMMIPASGLLPGFSVEYAYAIGEAAPAAWQPMSRVAGALPRLADIYQDQAGDQLRIIVPYMPGATARQTLALRVRNPEGSRSNAVTVGRLADAVDKVAKKLSDPQPALVDATVNVPDVEVLSYSQAAAALVVAGLKPKLVDDALLAPIMASAAHDALLVERQGVPAGEPVLWGDAVVVTIPTLDGTHNLAADQSEETTLLPVDVADDLSFAAGPQGYGDAATNARAIDDGTIAAALSQANLGESIAEQAAALRIGTDPGVSLDPERDQQRLQAAAVLKLVLESLVRQPTWRDLPGPLGAAITAGIADHEAGLEAALTPQPVAEAVEPNGLVGPIEPPTGETFTGLASTIADKLSIELDGDAREALAEHLASFAAPRWSPALLDRNHNGKMADDLVVSGIIWLFEQERLEPLANVVVVPTPGGGGNVAIVSDEPHATDWIAALLPLLVLPGNAVQPPPVAVTPAGPTGPTTPAGPTAERPLTDGKPLVSVRRGPDEVRVPAVVDEAIGVAERRLGGFGLALAEAAKFFQDDRVTDADPEARTWVKSGSAVRLEAVRRVPDLLNFSKQQADAETTRYKFALAASGPAQLDDVVIDQQPPGGEFVEVGSQITVDVAAIVPGVVGSLQREAAATLGKKGLNWRADTKAFGTDKVVFQDPPAGSLLAPQSDVLLELHLAVPNVLGRILGTARTTLEEFDLQVEVTTRLARDGDVVRGQDPRAGTYVPHQSLATLGPVLGTVPEVRGRTVGRAQEILEGGDYPVRFEGDLIDDDVVTFQTPAPGTEQERGDSVTLDARVQAPNVRGQYLSRAEEIIESAGGRLRADIIGDFGRRDVVYSQDPAAGQFVYPRTSIELVPGVSVPNVRGLTRDQAFRALDEQGLSGRVVSSGTEPTTDRSLFNTARIDGQRPNSGLYRRSEIGEIELWEVFYVPDERTVPDVVSTRVNRSTVQSAINEINNAGLTPIIVVDGNELNEGGFAIYAIAYAATNNGANPYEWPVDDQDPDAGTRVLAGSRVRILPDLKATFK